MATSPTVPSFGDIPPFTSSGALPPFLGGNPAVQAKMSPYSTTLVKLVDRFASSNVRKEILKGYLDHRAALLNLGITGFQWLDGSFLEDIEALESRPPGDIDLVTFVWRPAPFWPLPPPKAGKGSPSPLPRPRPGCARWYSTPPLRLTRSATSLAYDPLLAPIAWHGTQRHIIIFPGVV